jgi:virulence factor Mce-like protein
MMTRMGIRRMLALSSCAVLTISGCSFDGLNSVPLPGAVGRGSDAQTYRVEIANVGTLESNSPVLMDDVVVGSVGRISVDGWHAVVEVSVKPDVVVPANTVARVGQTSLLGSMHLALDPLPGEHPQGRLPSGATIALNKSSTYPSTERTLSALSVVVNAGGLGQVGDIVHNFNIAVSGRAPQLRELLGRLNTFVGTLNDQRDDIVSTIGDLNRFAGTLVAQDDVLTRALRSVPPALEVIHRERPRIVEALDKLGTFSGTAAQLVNDTQTDLVANLKNLGPSICALADVGPDIDTALAYAPVFPLGQNLIDRGIRGDYVNLFATFDITRARLKRGMAAGTPWYQDAAVVPAPGDPGYDQFYTDNPLGAGLAPTPPWLQSLPPDSPPLHRSGVAPLGVLPPVLELPIPSTPSGCG